MQGKPTSVPDPSVILLASAVYFVQGALSLIGIAFPLFLRQQGWGISEIAVFSSVVGTPWILKLLYGAISDGVPIAGRRRKPYVMLASLLSAASWLVLSMAPSEKFFLFGLAILGNVGFAMTDVVTDAVIVEKSSLSTTSFYQSLAWGFRSLGAILGGLLGGWLAQNFPYRLTLGLCSILPLITFVTACFIQEASRKCEMGLAQFVLPIKESLYRLFRGDLKWFSALLLVGTFSASFSTPFFFYLKDGLDFSESFLGVLSSLSWLGAMLGCFLYGKLFRRVDVKTTLRWSIGLNAVNVLSTYFIRSETSAALLFFAGGVLAYLTLLPLMGGAALLSRRKGIEGSLFALMMSVHNLGQILSVFIGGKLFDIIGLGWLILLSGTIGLTGLLFVSCLRLTEVEN